MTAKNFNRTVEVTAPLVLSLADLAATVQVVANRDAHTATVDATGDDAFIDALTVTYADGRLTVSAKGAATASGVSINVGGNSIQIGNGGTQNSFGRGGLAGVNISGGVITVGRGTSVQIDGDQVIVNGRNVATGEKPTPRNVNITVPAGTDIGAGDVDNLNINRVGGRVRAALTHQSTLIAAGVRGVKLAVRGQSNAGISGVGPVDMKVSGQSTVALDGRFGDVDLDVSGQSTVRGSSEFGHVAGSVSGQSTVRLGRAASQAVRSSGQSSVRIDAPEPTARPRPTGDWNF